MFQYIDRVKIKFEAGKGGNGCISFRRECRDPNGGPDGGDGGRGGDIYIQGDHNLATLVDFRYKKVIKSPNGRDGTSCLCKGRSGDDHTVRVPLGTQIYENGELIEEILEHGQELKIARGGGCGLGNKHFARSDFQAPKVATKGHDGESREVEFILKQIADVGVIGKPNAGKSTLISSISNAPVIIADYPFSTINPKLADVRHHGKNMTFIDIPGLIEGAHEGKGLGYQFLQHIERCKILLHLADVSNVNYQADIQCILNEVEAYDKNLINKISCLCLTKCDLVLQEDLDKAVQLFETQYEAVFCIDSWSKTGVNELIEFVFDKLNELEEQQKLEKQQEQKALNDQQDENSTIEE